MSMTELTIHTIGEKALRVAVREFRDFCAVEIKSGTPPAVKFFLYSSQEVINFKNNLLWAFEHPVNTR